jgi:hypothetical protein
MSMTRRLVRPSVGCFRLKVKMTGGSFEQQHSGQGGKNRRNDPENKKHLIKVVYKKQGKQTSADKNPEFFVLARESTFLTTN